VLAFLHTLPEVKRQPNLLFGAVKYLTGVMSDYGAFHGFVVGHQDDLRDLMSVRSTRPTSQYPSWGALGKRFRD
jgi:hypothetical protein